MLLLPSIIGGLPFLSWCCYLLKEARPPSRRSCSPPASVVYLR
nr:MAG TPA: hypothetical protein [Caudoviricetes sp.]